MGGQAPKASTADTKEKACPARYRHTRYAMQDVVALAQRLNAPVMTTYKAKGQISDSDPLACGVLGRSGTPVASGLMNKSDLIIVFGASFSQHTGIDQTRPLIQVDFERMALGKFHSIDTPVWGDVGITARLMAERLPAVIMCTDMRQEIASEPLSKSEVHHTAGRLGQ